MTDHDVWKEQMGKVEDCQDREGRLSNWEREFIDNIDRQLRRDAKLARQLTERQVDTLEEIWNKVIELDGAPGVGW